MTATVPIIDLGPWFTGTEVERREVAAQVDHALRTSGFLLITGHGVPSELRAEVRAGTRRFFGLPTEVKRQYTVTVGERGWLPPGAEANGYAEGTETPPDLKESLVFGADQSCGDPELDRTWFPRNVWPAEVPELEPVVVDYLARMRALANELLTICAVGLDLEPDFFTSKADHPSFAMNVNWYPSLSTVGEPSPGQFRIGPHTDFGTVTILDRQPGLGGLQIDAAEQPGPDGAGEWIDAPFHPEAFTINIGDLLARWTGDRWRSTRHRVLPPDPQAPNEELLSLIFFYDVNPRSVISSLPPPLGRVRYQPVLAGDYLAGKLAAITMTPPS